MTKKLKCILLVDDDVACNFFHKRLIKNKDCAEQVVETLNGAMALDYIRKATDGQGAFPDLIFLDINMPVMDGWEFLAECEKMQLAIKEKSKLVMLSSSINPDDKARAISHICVSGYENKYLSEASLTRVLEDLFAGSE